MIIPKEDIHFLVDGIREKDTHLVYQLISHIIQKGTLEEIGLDVDFYPLPEREKALLNQAKMKTEIDELIIWYDQHI
ncbi:hypothetical protein HHO41_03420 [Bacillus sp. DNRA2]|uniref:hypothetical protein n=1 Tax=Bacillus sp. DNRA2 TaxID=2723053 RepID=UPI00145F2F68|nr:hypothetical protein [Bacillus sp. DNRA2]NMD69324.1 hypothetical protein [Bacillus sp. DNRA2]